VGLLQLMCEYGDLMQYQNKERRGVFCYAALQGKK
jgi:ankyrin repeat protein